MIFGLLLVLGGAFRSVGRLLNIIFEFGAANPVLMFGLVVIIVVGFAIMTDSPATDVSAAKPACFDEPVPGTWVTTCQKTSNYLATDPYTPSKRPHLFGRSVHLGGHRQRDHQCRDAADRECEKLLIHWGLRTPRGSRS